MSIELSPIQRLTRDLVKASVSLGDDEVRFLVDSYYQMQDNRIRSAAQIRSIEKTEEPHEVLNWLNDQSDSIEGQIKRALDAYSAAHPAGKWLRGVYGIGPVIAAGLLAHIDIRKAPTVGHIWRFAGQDPTSKWEKKSKRPWNASLKVLCWKAGESFVKFHKDEKCFYGHVWRQRKDQEMANNEAGKFADQAAAALEKKKFSKDTDAYKHYSAGQLPPAHIHARARRYAVKLFLSHLHAELYRSVLGQEPPLPYPIAHQNHAHLVLPPDPH